ncbi:unnamed protein product [Camellia sinensis]
MAFGTSSSSRGDTGNCETNRLSNCDFYLELRLEGCPDVNKVKMAREGVHSAFEYLLKGLKVKLDAGQCEGFDSKIVADELLMKEGREIAEIEEDRELNKYLKIISTMVIQVTAVEYAYKAFRFFLHPKEGSQSGVLDEEPPPSNGMDKLLKQIKAQLDKLVKAAEDGKNEGSRGSDSD